MKKINKKNFFITIILAGLTFAFVSFAGPTQSPPGGNIPTPINVSATNQWKSGTQYTGELVRRALGIKIAPDENETLAVKGSVYIGVIGASNSFNVFSNGIEMNTTTICQTAHTYTNPNNGS